ncbi:MAG: hypothetical protein ABJZ55_11265 [Fuerstiella sp.]
MASQKLAILKGSRTSRHCDVLDLEISYSRQFQRDLFCNIKNSGCEAKLGKLRSWNRVSKVSGMLPGLAKRKELPDSVASKMSPSHLPPRTSL